MIARAAFAEAVKRLGAAGVETPERDARLLLAEAMAIAPDRLTLHMSDALTVPAARSFERMISARAGRQPVAQILGRRLFYGRWFAVTPDVLDPRPETETLIETALAWPFDTVLDLGTGTGILALTLLAERAGARGTATDLSPKALDVARRNSEALGLSDRLTFCEADWYPPDQGPVDLIVSNPPYIAATEMAHLAPEVRDHEPGMALTDGGDGLGAYRAIAAGARGYLNPGGHVLVEIGLGQAPAVSTLFSEAGLYEITTHTDMDGRMRAVSACLSG